MTKVYEKLIELAFSFALLYVIALACFTAIQDIREVEHRREIELISAQCAKE